MLTTQQIQETVTRYFKDKPVSKVYLFGSYARGEASEESDVDLLIEVQPDGKLDWQYFIWPEELSEQLGRKVDVVSTGSLQDDHLFTRFVLEQRKLLYGKPA